MSNNECIKVMVRSRPLNKSEKERGNFSVVQVNHERGEITIKQPNQADQCKVFSYDSVFDENDTQQFVYEQTAFQLVEQVVDGYNGTIFAYGQTGCGKTHSMIGIPSSEEHRGLVPRTFQHIMSIIDTAEDKKFLIRCSYIEIYNEDIHDLLSKDVKQKKELKESPDKGLFVKDLNQNVCKTVDEMEEYMNIGNQSRSTGATLMNQDSSRSHSIFTIYIECQKTIAKTDTITAGKLNLVDLAGSERQSKTGATGDRLKEANKINLSLSALGNVISALVDGKSSHVPYRDSKLTRLLQDSLGGNTKTIMIAAISPANYNYDETLGTLRYASRAKNIVNKPKINEDPKDALLKEYLDEINKLKNMIENQNFQEGGQEVQIQNDIETFQSEHQIQKEKEIIANQLKIKDQLTEQERQQKIKLEQMLKEYEKNMLNGGGQKDSKIQQKYKKIRNSLIEQKKQQEQLLIDKKRQEEELLEIKQNYNSVQEEIGELRKVYQRLKKKFKASEQEIKDIQRENEIQKQELLQTIRIQQKENSFYEQVGLKLMNESEIEIVKASSQWDENTKNYQIPLFIIKDKKAKFPNLVGQRLIDFVDKEKQGRILQIENKDTSNSNRYQIYNQNVTLNFQNNIKNNSDSINRPQQENKTNDQNNNKMEINFKATFQFNKENFDSENVDPIEEENQYDQDFE